MRQHDLDPWENIGWAKPHYALRGIPAILEIPIALMRIIFGMIGICQVLSEVYETPKGKTPQRVRYVRYPAGSPEFNETMRAYRQQSRKQR